MRHFWYSPWQKKAHNYLGNFSKHFAIINEKEVEYSETSKEFQEDTGWKDAKYLGVGLVSHHENLPRRNHSQLNINSSREEIQAELDRIAENIAFISAGTKVLQK